MAIWIVLGIAGATLLVTALLADSIELDLPGTDAVVPGEAIGAALAAAGVIGGIAQQSGAGIAVSGTGAAAAGLGVGWTAALLVRWLMRTPTDATPDRDSFQGAIGRVVTPVAEGGVGEVMVSRHGQPWKLTAQADGPLDVGTEVVVVEVRSATRVLVAPLDLDPPQT